MSAAAYVEQLHREVDHRGRAGMAQRGRVDLPGAGAGGPEAHAVEGVGIFEQPEDAEGALGVVLAGGAARAAPVAATVVADGEQGEPARRPRAATRAGRASRPARR